MAQEQSSTPKGAPAPRWLMHWLKRHQSPTSLLLHFVGIPITVFALMLAVLQLIHGDWLLWWRPVLLLVVGYLLQWIGHRVEGNDMGEVILIKKLLGRPYVAISPRYLKESADLQ